MFVACEEESKKSVLYGSRMRHKIAAREKMDCTLKMQVPIELATGLMQFAFGLLKREEQAKMKRKKKKTKGKEER